MIVFEVISRQSHELAELGRRNGVPNFRDIITSCGILGVGGIKELKEETRMRYNQDGEFFFFVMLWCRRIFLLGVIWNSFEYQLLLSYW